MLRLTQAPNIAIATLWADLLCEAGMRASVQRQYLGAAAGHLPPDQCLPEIWLEYDEHAAGTQPAAGPEDYRSAIGCRCGETVEGGSSSAGNAARLCRAMIRLIINQIPTFIAIKIVR